MKKLLLTGLGVLPLFLSAVSLEQTGNDFKIKAKDYSAALTKANGYFLEIKEIGGSKILNGRAVPQLALDVDWEKFRTSYNPPPEQPNRIHMKPVCKVITNTQEKVELEVSWNFVGGSIRETLTFNDTPAVSYNIDVDHKVRVYSHALQLNINRVGKDGIFLPDGVRAKGVLQKFGDMKMGSTWQCAWYPSKKIAYGIAIPDLKLRQGLEYAMQGKEEGEKYETSYLKAVFAGLSNSGKTGKKNFKYTVLLGKNPDEIRKEAEKVTGAPAKVEMYSFSSEKLITAPGEANTLLAQLRNHGTAKETVTLKTVITHGLNSKIKLDDVKVTLNPGEKKDVRIPVTYPKDVYKGLAFTTELYDSNGKLLDKQVEISSVSDFSSRDGMIATVNAKQGNLDGTEHSLVNCQRKRYIGTFYYYCWAHSMLFGLIPPTDVWIPRTEANYTDPISKKFLKGMISNAHSRGVKVYAMLTGLWNYDVAVAHPEWMQYCKDGQPWLYNGMVYKDGTRRIIVKANAYTEERATIWGNEMADCIDYFGFDGCRWDWNFIPNTNNDPLMSDGEKEEWYDNNGVPSSKLYPDPDETAQKALAAWRRAVNKRHPDFIYGTNYSVSKENLATYPKFFKEISRKSMILFESMLNYNQQDKNTFEKWGTELAKRADKVRENGGTAVVGWMRGTNPGSMAYELANYVCSSAGVKWLQSWQFKVESHTDIIRNRYFTRYADYYYSTDFLLNDKAGISQVSADRVLWKPFMRERKKDGYREIVIPMINLPKDDFICQYHDVPALKNPVFAITPAKGEKIDSVWVMTPEDSVEAKEIKVSGNQFKIENLNETAMVLIRLKGK